MNWWCIKHKSKFALAVVCSTFCLGATAQGEIAVQKPPPRGEYILRLSSGDGGFCPVFTRNLNEFRHLNFDDCNPRLSEKYPQFIRPQWKEVPVDMNFVKKVIETPPYERRLKTTDADDAKMWHIDVDLIGNGYLENLVRIDHMTYGDEHPYCSYVDNYQLIVGSNDPGINKQYFELFMKYLLGNDLVFDASTNNFYLVDWNRWESSRGHGEDMILGKSFRDIGAHESVMVYKLTSLYVRSVCWIDWVPARKQK